MEQKKDISVVVPKALKYGFTDIQYSGTVMRAQCKFCKEKTIISDKAGVTSNFLKHLQRIHPDR